MSKKYYFILSPNNLSNDRLLELKEKAINCYGSKDYQNFTDVPDYLESLKKTISDPNKEINGALFLIATAILAICQCDSVYVAKEWEDDDYCKVCHALAFSHGVDLVYESL